MIICFNKCKPSIPSDDNLLRDIQTTTLSGPPTLALFQSLNMFSPLLQQVHIKYFNLNLQMVATNVSNASFTRGY